MTKKRRRFSAEFKFQVALEAAKGLKTLNELSSQYGVHPNQISGWKSELLEGGATVFPSGNAGNVSIILKKKESGVRHIQ